MIVDQFVRELNQLLEKHRSHLASYNIETRADTIPVRMMGENTRYLQGRQDIRLKMEIIVDMIENRHPEHWNPETKTLEKPKEKDKEILI